jgi:predicted DNA-binding transcriptional regulator YafY
LKFGADVEVVGPKELKTRVQRVLLQAVGLYV